MSAIGGSHGDPGRQFRVVRGNAQHWHTPGGYLGRPQFGALRIREPLFAKAVALEDGERQILVYYFSEQGYAEEIEDALLNGARDVLSRLAAPG